MDKYESTCEKLKAYVRDREKEIAELRMERTNLSTRVGRQDDEAARQEVEFQQEIKALSSQLESMRWEAEQASSSHASRLVALESRLADQGREHAAAMSGQEQALRAEGRRATEAADARTEAAAATHARQKRELERRVLELQTLMSKEGERSSDQARVTAELRDRAAKAEAHVKKIEWELRDRLEAKEREVEDLITEKKDLKDSKQLLLDEYEAKMGELLSSLHSVEGAFVQQREQYELQLRQEASTREDELRRVGQRLRAQLEAAEDQAKVSQRMAEELKHQLAQREQQEGDRIRDLTRELEALRSSSTISVDKLQEELRASNAKLWATQSELKSTQDATASQREAVERFKAEVKSARDEVQRGQSREGELKREMASQNVNWQQRWERDRAAMVERHNGLTGVLQKQRDHLEGEVRKLEDRARELEDDLARARDAVRLARAEARTREVDIEKMRSDAAVRQRQQEEQEEERRREDAARAGQEEAWRQTQSAMRSVSPEAASGGDGGGGSGMGQQSFGGADDDDELAPASPLRPLSFGLMGGSLDGPIPSPEPSKLAQENAKLKAAVSLMAREMEEIRHRDRSAAIAAVNAGHTAAGGGGGGVVHINRRGSVDVMLGGNGIGGEAESGEDARSDAASSPMQAKLKEAEDDVQRLVDERERLMEVSNQVSVLW